MRMAMRISGATAVGTRQSGGEKRGKGGGKQGKEGSAAERQGGVLKNRGIKTGQRQV